MRTVRVFSVQDVSIRVKGRAGSRQSVCVGGVRVRGQTHGGEHRLTAHTRPKMFVFQLSCQQLVYLPHTTESVWIWTK